MKTLKVERMGDVVQGIRLHGDPNVQPEPEHVRIVFPGGDVDVVRTTDGDYWVHVRVDSEQDVREKEDGVAGKLVDARLDVRGKHASRVRRRRLRPPGPVPPRGPRRAQRITGDSSRPAATPQHEQETPMKNEKKTPPTEQTRAVSVAIPPPNFRRVTFRIEGTAPLAWPGRTGCARAG